MCRGADVKLESKYLVLATIACCVVALDQLTKLYIHSSFGLSESHAVIPSIFNITYVRNTGAAFGMLRNLPELARKAFFLSVPPIAMIVILRLLRNVANDDRWQIFCLSIIFGGAVGNYIDRLRFGYVIDFLDFHYKEVWSYPAFNIADSAIVCGVLLLVLMMYLRDRQAARMAKA